MKAALIKEFFKQIEFLKELEDTQLDAVCGKVQVKHYKDKTLLFDEYEVRENLFIIYEGEVELFKRTPYGEEKRLTIFGKGDVWGERALVDDSPHSTSARTTRDSVIFVLSRNKFEELIKEQIETAFRILIRITRAISEKIGTGDPRSMNLSAQYRSGRMRTEHDLLGERHVLRECYYGVQTLRASENFNMSGVVLNFYPVLIEALAMVKLAATRANHELGLLPNPITDAIAQACIEIMKGRLHSHFVVDMIQGGAGTSTNMNANEVIANRALEILGYEKGEYQYCHPNDHVNLSQSTNDVYPTAVKIALINANKKLIDVLLELIQSLRNKAKEFSLIIKMGRTQLQDAVPMTLGQEFEAYAVTLKEEVQRLTQNVELFLEVNMGATAIGTGINVHPDYSSKCIAHLREITGLKIVLAENLVEATQDAGAFVMYSSAVKRLAIKLSKICNDLRLLSSGPRTGIHEINLPPVQAGSSIMPGKVNPVIPEVVNQIAFKIIGNDLTVTLAAEAGQLELNVFEPVIVQSLFESREMLKNGMMTLKARCIDGITANKDRCRSLVENSIGLITALNPVLGYEVSTRLAKEALEKNLGVCELVLKGKLLSKEELDELLKPENMIKPR